jgi:hypothetical protein
MGKVGLIHCGPGSGERLNSPGRRGLDVKRSRSHGGLIVAVFLAFFATSLPRGSEYLDPGTGSYVFQVVIGAMLGAAVAIKMTWRRMWAFVSRRPRSRQPGDD